MHYVARNTVKLQATLKSAVSALSIRLCSIPSRWWIFTLISLGSGPVRPKVQGVQGLLQACYIHRKESCLVALLRCFSWPRQLARSVMPGKPKKVCIVGSGNWGSAIAKIVGTNAQRHDTIDERVTMYVYEEMVNGKKLTEIINETHENVKYLPGIRLPPNVVAVPDVVEAAKEADILVFVVPHQFIRTLCSTLLGKIKPTAVGLSLIKGFDIAESGGIQLISHIINKHLQIEVSVLMGANLANEVALEKFCETTIGCKNKHIAPVLRDIIQTEYFRVVVVDDVDTVEVCGALKNIVACAAGFVDGLELGDNTKAAVIRLGLMEMIKYIDVFYPGSKLSTFFESCGVADLITTCYGGRNRRVSEAFVKSGKSIEELEKELLNGQKLQGPITASEVNFMLKNKSMEDKFPLFTAVHRICTGVLKPQKLIECIREHPEHVKVRNGLVPVRCSL